MDLNWKDVENWLASNAYSANTIELYRYTLRLFGSEIRDIESLGPAGLRAWLDSHPWGSSMQWVTASAVKGFLRWRFGEDHPALGLRLKRKPAPPQRVLRMPAIRKLLASFDTSTPKGKRDLAMAGIMLDSGLRASEICRLEVKRIEYDSDLEIYFLRVVVKGGNWGTKTFSPWTAIWYADWMGARDKLLKKLDLPDPGKVFIGIGGIKPGRPMTRSGIRSIVKVWGEVAGIGIMSPHDLRRSMASNATLLGAPEDIVMKAGGWKSSEVFRRYTVGVELRDMQAYLPTAGAMGDTNRKKHS